MKLEIDPGSVVNVLHITDSHLDYSALPNDPPKSLAEAAALFNDKSTEESLDQVLASVEHQAIDLMLHTGDLLESAKAEHYRKAIRKILDFGKPSLITAGNHDDTQLLTEAIDEAHLPPRHIDAGIWRIIALNSNNGEQGGFLGDYELSAFHEYASKWDGHVLVGLHHPPLSSCQHPDCMLADAARFFEVADKVGNVAAVASGHLHDPSDAVRHNIQYLLGPSTCLQLTHKHPLPENNTSSSPGGGRNIQLLPNGEVRSELFWV